MNTQIFTSEALSKIAELSSHSVDLCLTDLPYGETAQEWDNLIEIEPMWKQLKRVMKKDSAIILFAQNVYQARPFHYPGSDSTRYSKTILEFDCVDNNSPERVHSNQKPVSMLQHLIRQHSQTGETVLDFCCGSGSTGVAAILEKRNFIGIDQNEIYTNYACHWISKVNGTTATLTSLMIGKSDMPLFETI